MLLDSLAPSSLVQYATSLKQWSLFCRNDASAEFFSPNRQSLLKFLTKRFKEGVPYGTLCTNRSAISLISEEKIGSDPMISRFLKGCFRRKPSKPKCVQTWDINIVLNYLRTLDVQDSLRLLTLKTVMLVALSTAHRSQTLAAIEINNIHFSTNGAEILITKLIKTSHPHRPQPLLKLPYLTQDKDICVASFLIAYLEKTKPLRGSVSSLFISIRPEKGLHRPVCSQTISRWLKQVLVDSGLDKKFTGHSTRHAASSAAFAKGASWEDIMKTAGWTPDSEVFAKFYNRPIIKPESRFANIVLQNKDQ